MQNAISNGRKHSHGGGGMQSRMRTNSFSNGQQRNNFRPSLSPEKLFEKYSTLAKEALSSGDKTLSENYYQHADHFMRIIEDKNKNFASNKAEETKKIETEEKNTANDQIADSENINKENK